MGSVREPSMMEIPTPVIEPVPMLVKSGPRHGNYVVCCTMYRGDAVPLDVNAAVATIKTKRTVRTSS